MAIGVDDNGNTVILFTIKKDFAEVVGAQRLLAIEEVLKTAFDNNLYASYFLALSGAMRWPVSLRPEIMMKTEVNLI